MYIDAIIYISEQFYKKFQIKINFYMYIFYLVRCDRERAIAYSATTVLPAEVWAATNTF